MTLGLRFDAALAYASEAHRKQSRKSSDIPYVGHLLGVSSIVIDYEGDEEEAIAALLHDAPEDQGGQARLDDIRDRFGSRVASIVEACSDSLAKDPNEKAEWPVRKRAYLQHLAANADASVFLVSAADKLHNLRAMLSDYAVVAEDLWKRFNPAAGKYRKYPLLPLARGRVFEVCDPRVARIAAELHTTLNRLEADCGAANDPTLSAGTGLLDEPVHLDGRPAAHAGAYEAMGRRWLGIGNIESRHWFCGLEPGGTERADWPAVWLNRFNGAEVIDGRMEPGDPDYARWFSATAKGQPTWIPLVRTLLAFKGEPSDDAACLAYQREHFAAGDGDAAVLELSAYAATNLAVDSPREKFMADRIARIRALMDQHEPAFLVCYGTTRRHDFEQIAGGPFDSDGFRISGRTVCAITIHPTPRFRPAPTREHWIWLGEQLRLRSNQFATR